MSSKHSAGAWWAVLLQGESPDIFGPFRSKATAEKAAEKWNREHGDSDDDRAQVVPLLPGPVR